MTAMTGDVEGPRPNYMCAFCGMEVTDHVLNPIRMVAHALEECRERLREQCDEAKEDREIAVNALVNAHSALDLLNLTNSKPPALGPCVLEVKARIEAALNLVGVEPLG
jgi:hypothetical protein